MTGRATPATPLLPWLALAVALSPVLAEWAGHLAEEPRARAALAGPLFLACAWSGRNAGPGWLGAVLLSGALTLEAVALLAGPIAIGRLALPLALCGMALWAGAPSLRVALLSLWAVPIPHTLFWAVSPALEALVLKVAAEPVRLLGGSVLVEGYRAIVPGSELILRPGQGGVVTAFILSGAAWLWAVRRGHGLLRAAVAALAGLALGVPAQTALVTVAVALGSQGNPDLANAVLVHAPLGWVLASFGVAWVASRSTDRRDPTLAT